MSMLSVSLLDAHATELREHLFAKPDVERAAYILFGTALSKAAPEQMDDDYLLLSHSVEFVQPDAILESSPWRISWKTSDVIEKLKIATPRNLTVGIVHNHNSEDCDFSRIDDGNERDLIRTIQNRNGSSARLCSVLFSSTGRWRARLWLSPDFYIDAVERRIIGDRFTLQFADGAVNVDPEIFNRQALAFGNAFNSQLRHVRVAVVGCGGTGSAVATLLARLGVGSIALIDNDRIELSNLNRLHGATKLDAVEHRSKVAVLADSIKDLDFGTEVIAHQSLVSDPECRNTLKRSHVVFGCTDDHAGRILLNRFAYTYQIPVIDIGLAIQLSAASNAQTIQALDGRVTVLLPGNACLLCRQVVDPRRAGEEALRRTNPAEFERRKAEAYVLGEQNPSPAVVTFTTEIACMAVNEMIQRLQGFRGDTGSTANRVRLFHRMTDLRPTIAPDPECRVCGRRENWCLGDMTPFLGIVG